MTRTFTKIRRDLWTSRGRTALMVIALAAGLGSLGTVLSMRGVLQREMTRNYVDTAPASATFDVGAGGVSDALLDQVRARPEVAAAERRTTLTARWRSSGSDPWGRALLFVREDFERQEMALLTHERGSVTPPPGTVLVERSALAVLHADIGDTIEVTVDGAAPLAVTIAGVVHEPALAPAVTEQAGYLYATPETLALLGRPAVFDELRVLVSDRPLDQGAVTAQVEAIGAWLSERGVVLHDVRIPPAGRHPHQAQSNGVLFLLVVFAALTLALASVLCASQLSITLARQVREIALMKAVGGTSGRLRRMYGAMILTIAVVALLVSAPLTVLAGRAGIDAVAALMNFDIESYAVPMWVYLGQVAAAVLLPLLAATPVILRACRVSVRTAMDDHGAPLPSRRGRGLTLRSRILQAALRNALRTPRRLAFAVALLGFAGAFLIGAVSLTDAWEAMTAQVYETRHYDVELELAAPAEADAIAALPGVETVEIWGSAPATIPDPSGLPVSHTYPDGGHGSFHLLAVPDRTTLIDFALREGRWLEPGERGAIVLNQLAAARFAPDVVGREITLVVEGRRLIGRVVGVVDEVASPAAAYVDRATFERQLGLPARRARVAFAGPRDEIATPAAIRDLQRALAARGIRVVRATPLQLLFNAMGEHVVVLIRLLLGLALSMTVVGVLALSATMSTNVVERTRELAVMQAIGARPSQIRRMVLWEGWFTAGLSLPLALGVGVLVAAVVGRIVGDLSFLLPLPLDLSWTTTATWILAVLALSALASLVPTLAATRRTVREALGQV
ncbi:FtsX-like permease family protein [Haliangium sp.]|uniref:ABC transporter permease n=1 Tax=Haliangium sp. TaxID=2663208 RepID=UPI003D10035B